MSILTEMLVLAMLSDIEKNRVNAAPIRRENVVPRKRFVIDESEVETGEPDGISIRVDRPRMSDYTNFGKFTEDLAKYKSLERAAKDCDWKNRYERCSCDVEEECEDDFAECDCDEDDEPLMLEISGEGAGRAIKSNKPLTFEELQRHMSNFDKARSAWW